MSNIFQGQLVRLRAVEPGDWQQHFEWDKDTDGGRLTDEIWYPSSTIQTQAWAENLAKSRNEGDEFRFQIETLDTKQFVGTLNTHHCNLRCGTFMYGIAIMPQHQRKGYAVDAIRLVLRYFFNERRYQKVTVEIYGFNEPSVRLHENLGFVLEGRLRRMIYTGGQYWDVLVYGMTREEFEARGWHV